MLKHIHIGLILLFLMGCAPPPTDQRPHPPDNQPAPPPANNQAQPLPNPNVESIVNEPPPTNTTSSSHSEAVGIDTLLTSAEPDCASTHFMAVQANPANAEYPAPFLDVHCTDDEVIIQTNNIPNYEFIHITPNDLQANNRTFTLPRNPTPSQNPQPVPLAGEIAISVNGLLIFGPTEAGRMNYRDPYLDQILDFCNGHTAPRGLYHLHARPDCLLSPNKVDNVGVVIGYALDGYPILAPYICEDSACSTVKTLQSSWQVSNPNAENAWEHHAYVAGSGDLDQCNGMVQDDGSYAYFATDTFPYIIGCYHGEVTLPRQRG